MDKFLLSFCFSTVNGIKLKNLGLVKKKYLSQFRMLKIFKKSYLHSFLFLEQVGNVFAFEITSTNTKVQTCMDYLLDVNKNSTFPPEIWAEIHLAYKNDKCTRTVIRVRFNKLFYTSQPNIFDFSNDLKYFQLSTYVLVS